MGDNNDTNDKKTGKSRGGKTSSKKKSEDTAKKTKLNDTSSSEDMGNFLGAAIGRRRQAMAEDSDSDEEEEDYDWSDEIDEIPETKPSIESASARYRKCVEQQQALYNKIDGLQKKDQTLEGINALKSSFEKLEKEKNSIIGSIRPLEEINQEIQKIEDQIKEIPGFNVKKKGLQAKESILKRERDNVQRALGFIENHKNEFESSKVKEKFADRYDEIMQRINAESKSTMKKASDNPPPLPQRTSFDADPHSETIPELPERPVKKQKATHATAETLKSHPLDQAIKVEYTTAASADVIEPAGEAKTATTTKPAREAKTATTTKPASATRETLESYPRDQAIKVEYATAASADVIEPAGEAKIATTTKPESADAREAAEAEIAHATISSKEQIQVPASGVNIELLKETDSQNKKLNKAIVQVADSLSNLVQTQPKGQPSEQSKKLKQPKKVEQKRLTPNQRLASERRVTDTKKLVNSLDKLSDKMSDVKTKKTVRSLVGFFQTLVDQASSKKAQPAKPRAKAKTSTKKKPPL